ncbi:MAG: NIPSNAP family protein, partial [Chitinophagaceae bacterium]
MIIRIVQKISKLLPFVLLLPGSMMSMGGIPAPAAGAVFELRVYHFSSAEQEATLDAYLKDALLPALHSSGIAKAGVFKALANDTASDKKIFVLIPFKSFDQRQSAAAKLQKNKSYNDKGAAFINAVWDKPSFNRMETILLTPFRYMTSIAVPQLTGPKKDRVYELRSYESASEKIFQNKVKMFNEGGEVALFKRLGFNAVFYGEVIAGASMPNLMYMTSFENRQSRDEHWKAFSADPEWKTLSAMPEYQKNV